MTNSRLTIVTGHYGSGKTEFCVNLAKKLKETNEKVSIADLDIVNTYFRTRDKKEFLEGYGVHVCESSIKSTALDLPAISAEVMGIIQNEKITSVLDIGGDPVGARVLARFTPLIQKHQYDLLFVINANRPETQTLEDTLNYLRAIEITSNLKVTGIVNSTHLLKDTTVEDVIRGHKLSKELSKATNIPIKYDVAIESVANRVEDEEIKKTIFPIKMYMREDWMS
ncbi:ATP-binding protein [Sedimentibacter sp. zth1]|uniref:nucleotide-binding protein n=1 Tax=Sedimentibacter sp. zth1 TaxID=2816908 RepID=UPI001F5FC429|nr:ATP-binding protein [Sedimentibacter sp. zth1]